ncbi:MAG: lasso peptide biosynthesis B2 protein [Acidobacteriota bacterium]|nr:lasso peptide biosynthesis B2 protein [Acidobacteriota bacterium]
MLKRITDYVRNFASFLLLAARFILRTPREALLMLRMAWWVFLLSGLIRVQPLPRVLNLMTPRKPVRSAVDQFPSDERMAQLMDLLLRIDAFVFRPICWKRAAVLHRYLALKGIPTRIVFGVRKENQGLLEGHAWLEVNDRPVFETSSPEYTVTYAFPS